MISLVKGQPVPDSDLVVAVGGDYEATDLVLCAHVSDPDVAICQHQANFIATGEFA